MTEVTTNGIVKWTSSDPASLVLESQTQGDSIELALSKRERFDFVWANSAERTAQTGMVQGSRGYQVDTKSEYLYDSSAWRLAIPYAEFTVAAKSIPNAVYTAAGNLTEVTANTTDTNLITEGTNGVFTIVNPGVYGFSVYATSDSGAGLPGQSHMVVSTAALSLGTQITRGYFSGGRDAMVAMPFYRVTASNTVLYMSIYQEHASAQNVSAILRIGRFG